VLHNDKVLVTALLTGIPGEYGLRHSHESGELSIHFDDALHPSVTWNPPGVLHGGIPQVHDDLADGINAGLKEREALLQSGNQDVSQLVEMILQLHEQMRQSARNPNRLRSAACTPP
jgi:hypothetical protein